MSYRFQRDGDAWRMFVMFKRDLRSHIRDYRNGALGVDLNVDHAALAMADADGNVVRTWKLPLDLQGKTQGQRLDILRKAAAEIAKIALEHGVPVVAERLDFGEKKARLADIGGKRYARMLSSFAYSSFGRALESVCARRGIRLVLVNPAYTSLIGRVKFARRYGLSVHVAASLSIARRGMGLSERLPDQPEVLLGGGDRVTLERPVRKARRHVWSSWNCVARGLKAVLAGRSRERRKTLSAMASRATSGAGHGGTGRKPRRVMEGAIPPSQSLGLRSGPAQRRRHANGGGPGSTRESE